MSHLLINIPLVHTSFSIVVWQQPGNVRQSGPGCVAIIQMWHHSVGPDVSGNQIKLSHQPPVKHGESWVNLRQYSNGPMVPDGLRHLLHALLNTILCTRLHSMTWLLARFPFSNGTSENKVQSWPNCIKLTSFTQYHELFSLKFWNAFIWWEQSLINGLVACNSDSWYLEFYITTNS